jgi:hypothetical protein
VILPYWELSSSDWYVFFAQELSSVALEVDGSAILLLFKEPDPEWSL